MADVEGHQPRRYFHPSQYIGVSAVHVFTTGRRTPTKLEKIPMVARVALIDYRGNVVLDTFVRPTHLVDDYRPSETGLGHEHLCNAPLFSDVQRRVSELILDKVLVGHRIWDFLSVLGLSHPALHTRDLALYRPLRKRLKSEYAVELPVLVKVFMGRNVGLGFEDPVELSRAAMDLFRSCEEVFEEEVASRGWPCDLPPERFASYFS